MTAETLKPARTKVFISYSHQDAAWLERLRVHLKPLERDYQVDVWDDKKITPGSKWRGEIARTIEATKVAVLLVSADFLSSDFIASDELPPLLKAAEEEGATILPVILSPSRFTRTAALSQFQTVNDPDSPLINMTKGDQEAVFVRVSTAIEEAIGTGAAGQDEPARPGIAGDLVVNPILDPQAPMKQIHVRLRIERAALDWKDRLKAGVDSGVNILLDGEEVASLKRGEGIDLDITAGPHTVKATYPWALVNLGKEGSAPLEIKARDGESLTLECKEVTKSIWGGHLELRLSLSKTPST